MVGSIAIIGAVVSLALMQVHSVRSGPQAPTPTPHLDGYQTTLFNESLGTFLPTVPTIAPRKYTGLSPELSVDKKVAIEVRHGDGTYERYDMARSEAGNFIKKLPKGDIVLQISPIYPASGGYALPTFPEISLTPTPTYSLNSTATIVLPVMPTAVQPKITDLAP